MKFFDSVVIDGYLDLQKNELRNARVQNLSSNPSSPVAGQVYYNSSSNLFYLYNGSGWVTFYPSTTTLDNITAPTASVSLNSQKITSLATPTASTDAATKAYVDGVAQGLSWKSAVRAATTANGTLATAFENGDTLDGVTLATGDRILLKDQSSGAENGIYTVEASGAPTRATDADAGSELVGAAVFVSEGTSNGNTSWVCTTNATITLGSTALVFAQIGGTAYTFTSGTQLSGSTVSAKVDNVYIEVNGSNEITLKAGGGTRKYVGTITGDGSTTSFAITHSLSTKAVQVSVIGTSSPNADELVYPNVTTNSTSQVTIGFTTAPTTGVTFNVIVTG